MKKKYQKPTFHYVPHIGALSNEEIAAMSDADLKEYLNQNQFSQKSKLYQANEEFVSRKIADEVVLIPTGNAAAQFNGMLELNESCQFVWNELQTPHTVYDAVLTAKKSFTDSNGTIEKDVNDYVEESLKYGLLKECEDII
jgi:hypothetical protein